MLRAFGISDTGRIRPTNEDCFAIDEDLQLCVVADGMGGHNAGEVAARIAVDTIIGFVRAGSADPAVPDDLAATVQVDRWPFGFDPSLSMAANLLRTSIQLANRHILAAAMADEDLSGMGTTVVAALIAKRSLTVAHVGDSRLYLLERDRLSLLTDDDSWLATVLAEDPQVDPAILQHHPMRNALTNVVGARKRIDVHVVDRALGGGERMLLSTDGVHGVLDTGRLEQLLGDGDDLDRIAARVVQDALNGGSRDNCTAVVARYSAD